LTIANRSDQQFPQARAVAGKRARLRWPPIGAEMIAQMLGDGHPGLRRNDG
jgi:hypothetical protein